MSELISPIDSNIEAGKAAGINNARMVNNVWDVPSGDNRFDFQPFSHLGSMPASSPKDITFENLLQQTSDDPCEGEETCSVGFNPDLRKSADYKYVKCAVEELKNNEWLWRYGEEACGVAASNPPAGVQPAVPVEVENEAPIVTSFETEQKKDSKILDYLSKWWVQAAVATGGIWGISKIVSKRGKKETNNDYSTTNSRKMSRQEYVQYKVAQQAREEHYDNPQSPLFGLEGVNPVVQNAIRDLVDESNKSSGYSSRHLTMAVGAEEATKAAKRGNEKEAFNIIQNTIDRVTNPEGLRTVTHNSRSGKKRRR